MTKPRYPEHILDQNLSLLLFFLPEGLKVTFDLSQPDGSRVAEIWASCTECDFPEYRPVEANKSYAILTNGYLLAGGDGFAVLRDNIQRRLPLGEHFYKSLINGAFHALRILPNIPSDWPITCYLNLTVMTTESYCRHEC